MPKLVLKDCYVVINSVNVSDHCSSVDITMKKDTVDTTNFSGSGRERVAGLKDESFKIKLQQDYASGSIDALLYPLYANETEFVVEVRPTSAAASVSNPKYTATCVLLEYAPVTGNVGALSSTDVTIYAQRAGIARATS